MKNRVRVGLCFLLLLLPVVTARSETAPADAEEMLRRELREKGLRPGYDKQNHRMVQLAVVAKDASAAQSNPTKLLKMRLEAFLHAECRAKGAIMRSLTHMVDIRGETAAFAEDDKAISKTTVESSARSTFYPYGCQIASFSESLENGILEVAVALLWTPDSERGIRRALTAAPDSFPPLPEPRVPSAEWSVWAEKQDFAHSEAFRCFRDSEGIWRFAGIGVADVEGKTEVGLAAAMRLANRLATANLAYALFGNVEASRHLTATMGESETDVESTARMETFVSDATRITAKAHFPSAEVYTATVVNPLTGRKMFVSVVGIEPRELAELKLLDQSQALNWKSTDF